MKHKLVLIFLFVSACLYAEIVQYGCVKTRGRMVNGQHITGKGLPGTVVDIQGRSNIGVKNSNGAFSFPIVGKQFYVKSVTKKDYVLLDADAVAKTYTHTEDTIFFVMETPEQILQDRIEAERKLRKTLNAKIQARDAEIERLRLENKISQQEYQAALQKLYAEQSENDKLISEMAERYSTLDYDQMDEFYNQVSNYIEQCEFVKVDSLLRSRGNVHEQVEQVLYEGQVIQQEEAELAKVKEVHGYTLEELAERCYNYYLNFKMLHENDSAAVYLKRCVQLDSTNANLMNEYAIFVCDYLADYDEALQYFQKFMQMQTKSAPGDNHDLATAYNNLGYIYYMIGEYDLALENYQAAVDKGVKYKVPLSKLADFYGNIGDIYYYVAGDYELALKYFKKALKLRRKVKDNNILDIASSYNAMGLVYWSMGENDIALQYYNQYLSINQELGEELGVAIAYGNIASAYSGKRDYQLAQEYDFKSLELILKLLGSTHPRVATCYNNIGLNYNNLGDYDLAIEYHKKALEIRIKTLGPEHHFTGTSYQNLGSVYLSQKEYDIALDYYFKAIAILQNTLDETHTEIGTMFGNIGWTYYLTGHYAKAQEYVQKAVDIYLEVFGPKHMVTQRLQEILGMCKEAINSTD